MLVAINVATRCASAEQVVSNNPRIIPRRPFASVSAKSNKQHEACCLRFTWRKFHCGSPPRSLVG